MWDVSVQIHFILSLSYNIRVSSRADLVLFILSKHDSLKEQSGFQANGDFISNSKSRNFKCLKCCTNIINLYKREMRTSWDNCVAMGILSWKFFIEPCRFHDQHASFQLDFVTLAFDYRSAS